MLYADNEIIMVNWKKETCVCLHIKWCKWSILTNARHL